MTILKRDRFLQAAAGLCLLIAGPTLAGEAQPQLEMTVIRDSAQGETIIRGRFAKALERLDGHRDGVAYRNNLCVAQARAGDLAAARTACDAAIDLARDKGIGAPPHVARLHQRHEALALTNRGVLAAMQGQTDAAREDFAAAIALSDDLSAPERNLALVSAR
ncbi:MAG: hypothetical protein AAGE01_11140 [Pseudomonadota bacterium]